MLLVYKATGYSWTFIYFEKHARRLQAKEKTWIVSLEFGSRLELRAGRTGEKTTSEGSKETAKADEETLDNLDDTLTSAWADMTH